MNDIVPGIVSFINPLNIEYINKKYIHTSIQFGFKIFFSLIQNLTIQNTIPNEISGVKFKFLNNIFSIP